MTHGGMRYKMLGQKNSFLGKIYLIWCTIPPFDKTLLEMVRYLILTYPQKVSDLVVKDGVTYPLFVQFIYNKLGRIIVLWNHLPIAQLTYIKWENVEIYEPVLNLDSYQLYQETYDGFPFIKHWRKCGFTSTEPSVSIVGDFKHYNLHCQQYNYNLDSK